jgi:aarF domain-containing kinase
MRAAGLFGRFCLKRGLPRLPRQTISWPRHAKSTPRRAPLIAGVLMTTLGPAAFLKLAEENDGKDKTAEMQMLEVSREEVRKTVSPDAQGVSKLCQTLWVYFYYYVYDPIATGFRFVHLAIIFIPVVVTVPAIWIGRRVREHDGARSGTLWWYRFLVKAMERAGPAFIKVRAISWGSKCRVRLS